MTISNLSDLHGFLPNVESCDLVLIAGDIFPLEIQTKMNLCKQWLRDEFLPWASNLPCEKVLVVAGNHDFYFERNHAIATEWMKFDDKVTYLKNCLYEFKDIKIFGTPYCKIFGSWAFMRTPEKLAKYFDCIPENVDILLTHDAPYGCNDVITEDVPWNDGSHIGNPQLAEAIINKKPKYNIHGHLHSTLHEWEQLGDTKVINVSIKNERYEFAFPVFYFNIN